MTKESGMISKIYAGLCSGHQCGRLKKAAGQFIPDVPDVCDPDKLSLALEPESAAIFCQTMSRKQLASFASMPESLAANSYLVVDIGGGTVDISAHQVNDLPGRRVKVIHPPAGNHFGGSRVNLEFQHFLENLVGDPGFSKYVLTGNKVENAANKARLDELINDTFEEQKRIFGNREVMEGKLSVRLPFSFMGVYKHRVETGIDHLSDFRIQLSGTDLRMESSKFGEFFNTAVTEILMCISQTLENAESEIEAIYIVGGFGGCRYLYKAIEQRFGNDYKCITPTKPDFTVVQGAIMFRYNKQIIESRRADATYGVHANIPFIEGLHDETYKVGSGGEAQCTNIFSTFVEVGDVVSTNEVVVKSYKPSDPNQDLMVINMYSSPEKDVWYTTGKRPPCSNISTPVQVDKVGELTIPLHKVDMTAPRGEDEESNEREIEVTFDFSHTEIQVRGFDRLTKSEIKVVIDFLSA